MNQGTASLPVFGIGSLIIPLLFGSTVWDPSAEPPNQFFNCERQKTVFGEDELKFLFKAKAVSPIRNAWPFSTRVPTITGFDQVSAPGAPETGQAA
jgi:hypothetical protein